MDFSAEGILARMKAALKNEDTKSYFLTMEKLLNTYVLAESGEIYFSEASQWIIFRRWLRSLPGLMP